MRMFHITKGKFVPGIIVHGLRINSGKLGFCSSLSAYLANVKSKYGMQPIFLTDDPTYIVEHMLSPTWTKTHKATLVEVEVDLNEGNSSFGWFQDVAGKLIPKEYRYYKNIPVENIISFKKMYENTKRTT